jgi:Trk-type K+ transport system membrane component
MAESKPTKADKIKTKFDKVKQIELPFWRWMLGRAKNFFKDTRVSFYVGLILAITGIGAVVTTIMLSIDYPLTTEVFQVLALALLGGALALHGYYRDQVREDE